MTFIGGLRLVFLSQANGTASLRMTGESLSLDAGGFTAPEVLAKLAFEQFSGAGLGQRAGDESHDAREFEFGDTRFQEGKQLLFVEALIRLEDDDSGRNFSPSTVRGRNDGTLEHGGMSEDGFLHLEGGNIFAAANDDVFFAIDDVDVVFGVPDGHVSGAQPAVAEDGAGGFGFVVVSVHHVVAADGDLAHGFEIAGDVAHFGVHHPHLAAHNRPAGGGEAPEPLSFVGADHGALGLGGGGHGRGFGKTVAGLDFATEGLLEAGNQLGGRGSAAGSPHSHAGGVELAEFGTIEQRVGHGGNEGHGGGPFLLNKTQHVGGIEAANHDVLAPAHGDALRTSPAVGVKQRYGVELHVGVSASKRGKNI